MLTVIKRRDEKVALAVEILANELFTLFFNPFNASCSKLLLFEDFSVILV